jgi:hypothetical protein
MRFLMPVSLLLIVAGCGGGSGPRPAPGPVPNPNGPGPVLAPMQVTDTFSGTTTQVAAGACTGDSHNITTAEGDMSARLIATSDPAGALSVQVCSAGIDDGNCSVRQQRIAIDQVVTGTRRGQAVQNLKLLPHNCVFSGGAPIGTPVTYAVSVTYWKPQ